MKRSEINKAIEDASEKFKEYNWILPPNPKWDVTDFGLGEFNEYGLVLVNLTEQKEYCEKIMFSKRNQKTPQHYHKNKKEDIICRYGKVLFQLFADSEKAFSVEINGELKKIKSNDIVRLESGERITLAEGVSHSFWPISDFAIIGEVSTANDDDNDNFFANPNIGRFSKIEEDEKITIKLMKDIVLF